MRLAVRLGIEYSRSRRAREIRSYLLILLRHFYLGKLASRASLFRKRRKRLERSSDGSAAFRGIYESDAMNHDRIRIFHRSHADVILTERYFRF